MKLYKLGGTILAGVLTLSFAASTSHAQAKADMKDAGHATKDAAVDTGHATKTVAKKTGHGTAKVARKTAHGTKVAAVKTGHATENLGDKIAGKPATH